MEDEEISHRSVSKTFQDIVDKVDESLPLRVSAVAAEKHPQLMTLLTSLSQHLDRNGRNKNSNVDILQAESALQNSKHRWLQHQVLYQELQDLLMDQQLNDLQSPNTQPGAKQFYNAVQECLSIAEIRDYLDFSADPLSNVTLLGLKREELKEMNPHKKHLSSIQQKLIPEVEERLRKKCEMLVDYYDCTSAKKTESKFALAKASQLPEILEGEKRDLTEEENLLEKERHNREKQFWLCYKALIDSLEVLEKLITRHRLSTQTESNMVVSEWLAMRCEAMYLKIRVFEMQLLCDTYYSQTVGALNVIKHHLDTTIRDTEAELTRVGQSLNTYESVGLGFENIVREYTQLQDEIENKRWAMRELKISLETSD